MFDIFVIEFPFSIGIIVTSRDSCAFVCLVALAKAATGN